MPIHFKEISITFEKTYNAKLSHTNSNHPQSPPRFAWSNFPFSVYHSLPHPPPVHYPPDKVQSYRCNPNRKSFERMIFNISEVCGMRIVPNRVGKKKVDLGSNYMYVIVYYPGGQLIRGSVSLSLTYSLLRHQYPGEQTSFLRFGWHTNPWGHSTESNCLFFGLQQLLTRRTIEKRDLFIHSFSFFSLFSNDGRTQ